MTSRRDLIKFFGIGTVIAPAVGAQPLARLIEVPKLEIIEATKIPSALDLSEIASATLTLTISWKSGATFPA